jgi:hypothetical protein
MKALTGLPKDPCSLWTIVPFDHGEDNFHLKRFAKGFHCLGMFGEASGLRFSQGISLQKECSLRPVLNFLDVFIFL